MSPELYQQVEPDEVGVSSAYLGNIDALQERYLAEDAYQGSVVLVARHGKVCYFKAFGKADEGVPMATDSIFRLASMSKVIAAVAVMQLFEQGRIALHEPISTYLPEFADPKVAVVKDWQVTQLVTAEREITVHDLLTMTAGMTNTWWHRVFEPSVYGVVPQLYKDAGVVDDMSAPATTLEENIKKLAQMPLIAHPGTMFDYSNNSVDTLCRLVEVVSGLDFDTYQLRHILDPLQMHETWFFTPDDQQHRIAAVYEAGRDEKVTEGENAPSGSLHYLGGPGAYSWQGFFSTKFVNNPRLDTVILTMSTPGFDGALPHNLRLVAAATAAVIG